MYKSKACFAFFVDDLISPNKNGALLHFAERCRRQKQSNHVKVKLALFYR